MVVSKVKTFRVLYLIYQFEFVPIHTFTITFDHIHYISEKQTKPPQQQQQQQQNLVYPAS